MPLNNWQGFRPWPSGLQVPLVISRLYVLTFPVVGHFASKSVAALNPLVQHCLVNGAFVQAESATLEVVDEVAAFVVVAA